MSGAASPSTLNTQDCTPQQHRSSTPVTVTHFTDRGKLERVPVSNLIELGDMATPLQNSNPFAPTNPFHQMGEKNNNPFLNPFTMDLHVEENGSAENEELNHLKHLVNGNKGLMQSALEKKVCSTLCL